MHGLTTTMRLALSPHTLKPDMYSVLLTYITELGYTLYVGMPQTCIYIHIYMYTEPASPLYHSKLSGELVVILPIQLLPLLTEVS